jgi:hypothetical protein
MLTFPCLAREEGQTHTYQTRILDTAQECARRPPETAEEAKGLAGLQNVGRTPRQTRGVRKDNLVNEEKLNEMRTAFKVCRSFEVRSQAGGQATTA